MVIIDTSVLIDHLRTTGKGKSILSKVVEKYGKHHWAISIITIQELYQGQSTRIPSKEKELLALLSPFQILPYSYEVAQLAGEIGRDVERPIELGDAAIAATTIVHEAELLTLNTKDFVQIPELKLFSGPSK